RLWHSGNNEPRSTRSSLLSVDTPCARAESFSGRKRFIGARGVGVSRHFGALARHACIARLAAGLALATTAVHAQDAQWVGGNGPDANERLPDRQRHADTTH